MRWRVLAGFVAIETALVLVVAPGVAHSLVLVAVVAVGVALTGLLVGAVRRVVAGPARLVVEAGRAPRRRLRRAGGPRSAVLRASGNGPRGPGIVLVPTVLMR